MPDANQPVREAFAGLRAGDPEAFLLIYRLCSPAVFRFALHMTGDRMKAGEITQDVFVWLMHHPESFDGSRGEPAAFLIGVTRKLLLRQRRNERRWVPLAAGDTAQGPLTAPFAAPAMHESRAESQTEALRDAIGSLPVRYREVVVLCDLEEKTYEAAAEVLECAVGTVRSRLHRARALLGRKLQSKKEIQRCAV